MSTSLPTMPLQEHTPQLEVQPPAIMQITIDEAVELGQFAPTPVVPLIAEKQKNFFPKKKMQPKDVTINEQNADIHVGAQISKHLNLQIRRSEDERTLISIDIGDDATSRFENTSVDICYDEANKPLGINSSEWTNCRGTDVMLFKESWANNTQEALEIGNEEINGEEKQLIGGWLIYVCGNDSKDKNKIELDDVTTRLSRLLSEKKRILDEINISLTASMFVSGRVSTNIGSINKAFESITYNQVCDAIVNDSRTTYIDKGYEIEYASDTARDLLRKLVNGTLLEDQDIFYTVTSSDLSIVGNTTQSTVRIYRWLKPKGGIYNQHAREIAILTNVPIWATVPKQQRTRGRQLIQQIEIERSNEESGKVIVKWGANPNMSAPPAKRILFQKKSSNNEIYEHILHREHKCWADAVLTEQEKKRIYGFEQPQPMEFLACSLPTMLGLVSANIRHTKDVYMLSSKKNILWTQTATGGVESARVCHVLVRRDAERVIARKQRIRICYVHGVGRNSLAEIWGVDAQLQEQVQV